MENLTNGGQLSRKTAAPLRNPHAIDFFFLEDEEQIVSEDDAASFVSGESLEFEVTVGEASREESRKERETLEKTELRVSSSVLSSSPLSFVHKKTTEQKRKVDLKNETAFEKQKTKPQQKATKDYKKTKHKKTTTQQKKQKEHSSSVGGGSGGCSSE